MAGLRTSAQGSRPKRLWSFSHPSTQPGTVTVWIPSCGIEVKPLAFMTSIDWPLAAQPLAFSPESVPVLASQ